MTREQILAIRPVLEANFYSSEEVASILELALIGKKNVLLYGPGGHAKSTMIDMAMKAAKVTPFVKSFSEGTTVDDIYGGLDIPAYTNGELKHLTQNSFLNHEVAVFEELFDAPAATLCSLKDTLTAKAFRAGAEYCQSQCNTIIALTNVNPAEIEALGAAQKALIERFPLQLEVKWKSYDPCDFMNMLMKVYKVPQSNMVVNVLGEVCAKANGNISPRTCCHMFESLNAYMNIHKCTSSNEKMYPEVLKFFDEVDLNNLRRVVSNTVGDMNTKQHIEILHSKIKNLQNVIDTSSKQPVYVYINALKQAKELSEEISNMRVSDNLYEDRENLISWLCDINQAITDLLVS